MTLLDTMTEYYMADGETRLPEAQELAEQCIRAVGIIFNNDEDVDLFQQDYTRFTQERRQDNRLFHFVEVA